MAFRTVPAALIVGPLLGLDEFIYSSPTPAPGNLLKSTAAAAGTDQSGNAYLAGDTTYGSIAGIQTAVNSNLGVVRFYTAATQAGPWTAQGLIQGLSTGDLSVAAASGHVVDLSGKWISAPNLALTAGATPPAFGAAATVFATALGNLASISANDGNAYGTQTGLYRVGTAQTISSTSPVAVATLGQAVAASRYRVRGQVIYKGNQAAGVPTLGFTGPAVSDIAATIKYIVQTNNGSGTSPVTYFVGSGLPSEPGPTLTSGGFVSMEFDMWISFSGSGTLQLVASTSVAADTYQVQADSYMEVATVG